MIKVAFGVFDWIDRTAEPLHRLYEERLQLLEVADSAGFFCYHLAEHHSTPLGMAPSPALFLAAAAQRTRRIRLPPLVYLRLRVEAGRRQRADQDSRYCRRPPGFMGSDLPQAMG